MSITGGNIFLSNFANTTPQLIPKLTDGRYSDAYAQGAVLGAGGISAGGCATTSGQCTHTFAQPYNVAPVCTATVNAATQLVTAPAVSESSTAITITATGAPDGTMINWMCYLAGN